MKIRKLLLSFVMSVLFSTLSFSAIYTITSTADDGTPGTLRWAIAQAAATIAEVDIITFNLPPNSTINLTGTLSIVNDPFGNGGFTTIQGPGADLLTISGNNTFALFEIRNGDIYGVTLTGGHSDGAPAAINVFGDGAITTLSGVKVTNNTGTMGAIHMNANNGVLNIYNSVISGNAGANNGCGVKHNSSGTVNIINTTITGNVALYGGGGINNQGGGPFNIHNSIVSKNLSSLCCSPALDDITGAPFNMGTNLIGGEPLFVMDAPAAPTTGGDFNLQDGSPAHNTGVNGDIPSTPFDLFDIAGNPRITTVTVDLGAYEKLPPPDVDVTKTDEFLDENNDGIVDFGETIRYTIVASNAAMVSDALGVFFDTAIDPNTSLIVGSVTTTQGSITTGNNPADNSVSIDVGTLVSGTSITIIFDVAVTFGGNGNFVSCQGTVSGSNFEPVLTDDPDEVGDVDPTLTAIPTLSQWGIIALAMIMLIFGLVVVRQRKLAI